MNYEEIKAMTSHIHSNLGDDGIGKSEALALIGVINRLIYDTQLNSGFANLMAHAVMMDEKLLSQFKETQACKDIIERLTKIEK